ncbi:BlaI/MecI/CopY family transcriptional regulator [Austwickia chelonae]|uniref:BlaI/MecI/CopY family transcriptional regulator n=1 Tax=Austwickia chelonae TaxID=100225 RepID=UPI001F077329|nr:BlaI/MecI/CopY family transcriptional regulator [Austwickia chelonae]
MTRGKSTGDMRAPRHADSPRLGPLEAHVLDILWDRGPSSIRDIITVLDGRPAYTTIATVLGHLVGKELVEAHKDGRSVRYAARTSREAHTASLMSHALDASHDRAASILHFVEAIPEGDRALLRAYLADQEIGGRR